MRVNLLVMVLFFGVGVGVVAVAAETVQGTVFDLANRPLPGVTVSGPDGAETVSDSAGRFHWASSGAGVRDRSQNSGPGWTFHLQGNRLSVHAPAGEAARRLELLDASGKIFQSIRVSSAAAAEFSLSALPAGLYFVRITALEHDALLRFLRVGYDRVILGDGASRLSSSTQVAGFSPAHKPSAQRTLVFTKDGYETTEISVDGSRDSLVMRLASLLPADLEWKKANLTWYTSYPDPESEECVVYNGCQWAGQFAALNGVQPESWVAQTNIAAVHSKDFASLRLRTLRLKQGAKRIDVRVFDYCSDSDCDGCCTRNAGGTDGYLVDVESYTRARFGSGSGQVEWTCLDCPR